MSRGQGGESFFEKKETKKLIETAGLVISRQLG